MFSSVGFSKFRFGVLGLALVFVLGLGALPGQAQAPPSAPPVTADSVLPNLFYGATPADCASPQSCPTPVLVFVHGLGGTYADWLEANNCPGSPTPCGFLNGQPTQGTKNDMYDYAYQAGFRTAFMSLNANNTNNSASIQTNAAMLETVFPRILSHFSVSKVYFICHSKGGLDLQAALATPQWLGIASAVFTFGTPNQGDALADYIFFTSNGQALGQLLGLNGPGVQSLETTNVEQLRNQWDPIFQNAQIPFYTVAGDICSEPKPSTACKNTVSGPILQAITGGTNSPPNDELVTEPETFLPTTYSMVLGFELNNHYQLRLGDNSWSTIYARVMGQENQQPGFTRVATGGFGDQHNTFAWSMAWFNGKLYVGTGREVNCVGAADAAIKTGIPTLYPPIISDCPSDYHLLQLQAEIWQYTPQTNAWVRVYQSPNSLTTTSNAGKTVSTARDIGFRSLAVVTERSGTQALYAGGVTSGEMFEPNQTVGGWPPPRILRSVDGVTWAPLPQDAGTFLGDISQPAPTGVADQTFQVYSIRAGSQLNGVLYLQVGDYSGVGRVIASVPGTDFSQGDNNFQLVSPPAETLPIWDLLPFNGFMYANSGAPYTAGIPTTQYGVWKTNGQGAAPYTWTPIIDSNGGFAQGLIAPYAISMQIFSDPTGCPATAGTVPGGAGGCLYIGTDYPNEMVRIHPDTTGQVQVNNPDGSPDTVDSWDLVVGNPRTIPPGYPGAGQLIAPLSGIGQYFDNGWTEHFYRMGVGGMGLYMSTLDRSVNSSYTNGYSAVAAQEYGADLYRTNDGIHWTVVSKIGMGDGYNIAGRCFQPTPFGLYWGTLRETGGAQVFMIDNTNLDFNQDHVIDQKDVNLMTARLNTKARPNDPMDLDQDGRITSADIQLLKTQCTYPNCAVPAVQPASTTLGVPVLHSAPGPLGGTVSLDWPAIPNAKDYLVYRYNMVLASNIGTPYGYPGPVTFVTRVTTPTFSEPSPSTNLQLLYFVRAEDANGNLSAPSNIVGGPSLAAQ